MRFKFNWHQDKELYDTEHFLIANIGGYGSGKSQVLPFAMRDRSKWDTEGRHGLFANSVTQIQEGILPEIFEWLEKLGIEYVFGSKEPVEWNRMWRRLGIPFPQRGPRSPHTLILKTGYHSVCGGIANKAYKRFKGFRFQTIWLEEVAEYQNAEPIEFLLPRCRCGDFNSGRCQARHRHQIYLHANPPDPRQPHWIRDWIKGMCRAEAERLSRGEPPFFLYIRSSTYDNVENVGPEYITRLRQGLDPATAEAMINGSLEVVQGNTTFDGWSSENVARVAYDRRRALHVAMDFNTVPAASTLGHDLLLDEVPPAHRGSPLTYVGVCGETANFTRMTAIQHAKALLDGDRERCGKGWPRDFTGLRNHEGPVYMYGDSSGHMHRVESETDRTAWEQVNDVLMPVLGRRYHFDVPKANPSVYESVALLNGKVLADDGRRTYFVDPICTELRKDFEQVIPSVDGSTLIDKRRDGNRTHWVDGERYKVWIRNPGERRGNLKELKSNLRNHLTTSFAATRLASLGELPTITQRRFS